MSRRARGAVRGATSNAPDQTLVIFGALSLILLVYCTFRSPVERVLMDATSSVFALCYVGLTLLAIPTLREQPNGPTLVVFLLCVVWAGDIVALYVGRMWGKRKLAPTLSPNKTWAGAIGSRGGQPAGGRRAVLAFDLLWRNGTL